VHLDFIALAETATPEAVEDLIREAANLTSLPSVQLAGLIRSNTSHLANIGTSSSPLSPSFPGRRRGAGDEGTPTEQSSTTSEQASLSPSFPGRSAGAGSEGTPTEHSNTAEGVAPLSEIGEGPGVRSAASDFDLAFFFVLDAFTSLEPFGTDAAYIRFLQGKAARILRGFAGADIALDQPFPDIGPNATCLALIAPDQTYDWEVRAALESWAQRTRPQPPLSRGRETPPSAEPSGSMPDAGAEPPLSRGGEIPPSAPSGSMPDAGAQPPLSRGGENPPGTQPGRDNPHRAEPGRSGPGVNSPSTAIGLAIGERQRYRGCVLSFTTTETAPQRIAGRRFQSSLITGRASRL
jgi:hypothetical protein